MCLSVVPGETTLAAWLGVWTAQRISAGSTNPIPARTRGGIGASIGHPVPRTRADAGVRRRKALVEAGVLLVGRWVPAGLHNNLASLIKYHNPSGCRLMFPVAVVNRSMIGHYS